MNNDNEYPPVVIDARTRFAVDMQTRLAAVTNIASIESACTGILGPMEHATCEGSVPGPLPASGADHTEGRISYRGIAPVERGGGELVMVVEDGVELGPLPHIVKHSPGGFAWGYGGSGPADLARSLLIHALELAPDCEHCTGTGAANGAPSPRGEGRRPCWWCDGGYTLPTPAQYQAFKFDIVARFPLDCGWEIGRDEIRAWAAAHPAEERDK